MLCQLAAPGLKWTLVQPTDITRTQYTKCRLYSASWGWASNARNMYRHSFLINWIKRTSRWFHYTDILWCTVSRTLWADSIQIGLRKGGMWECRVYSRRVVVKKVMDLQVMYSVSQLYIWQDCCDRGTHNQYIRSKVICVMLGNATSATGCLGVWVTELSFNTILTTAIFVRLNDEFRVIRLTYRST
jgi:hypothetical protein